MTRKITLFPLVLLCLVLSKRAQTQDIKETTMTLINEAIKLDGRLEEQIWQKSKPIDQFWNHRPIDKGVAEAKTEIRLLYDQNYLYVGIKCWEKNNQYIIQTLKRDQFGNSDGLGVILDPIGQKNIGFFFGVNAGGAQTEGLIYERNLDTKWDIQWYSKVTRYADSTWTAEMIIPFKSLRYEANTETWGINFIRNDLKRNQFSTWTSFSANFSDFDLGYTGKLHWPTAPPQVKGNIGLLPYASSSAIRDFEEEKTDYNFDFGLDAKVAITPSLNLDLTINPDFSTIDVDRQVINLSRFSLFFPERRPFFQENSDLFQSFGNWEVLPFFSRSIGLNNGQLVPILFGGRLSGNLDDKSRINLMNVQTAAQDEIPAQNYTVAAFQRQLFQRSSIRGLFTNRQKTSNPEISDGRFNRTGGLEFNYLSNDGKWRANAAYQRAFLDQEANDKDHYEVDFNYNSRGFRFFTSTFKVGENYLPELGFVPRLFHDDPLRDTTVRIGYFHNFTWMAVDFYPKEGKKVVFHGPRFSNGIYWDREGSFSERNTNLIYELDMANRSQIDVGISNRSVKLFFPFSPIGDGEKRLPLDTYNYSDFFFDYDSDPRRLVSAGTVITYGGFFNGNRLSLNNYVRLRLQPWVNIELRYIYNWVDLKEFGKESLHLFAPRVEVSFSNKLFWTTFFQHNTQANNFNINSRLQWRYRPMSDLYIVLSNNYGVPNWRTKDLGLVVKFTRWFQL